MTAPWIVAMVLGVGAQSAPAQAPAMTIPIYDAPAVLRTFEAEEAHQGVAVDAEHVYVIGNRVIGKYTRETGQRVARFESPEGGPIIHMNGGIVINGRLYCSHSNFPGVPMQSSIEIFDPATLEHIGTQSFGIYTGSLVWMDKRNDRWYVAFGHYNERGGEPGRPNTMSSLVVMDEQFRRIGGYAFPPSIIARWGGMTASGGVFGPDGLLYVTGHHAPEIYVLRIPSAGSVLEPVRIIRSPVEGQGIALDPKTGELFQMQRRERKIYVLQLFPRP